MIDKLDDSTEHAMNEGRGLCRVLAVGMMLADNPGCREMTRRGIPKNKEKVQK